MNAHQMARCGLLTALLFAAAATVAEGLGSNDKEAKELFPGAKLLYKLPIEALAFPQIHEPKAGPRLVVMVSPKEPAKNAVVDDNEYIVWDMAASKELHRTSSKLENFGPGPYLRWAFTPDAKKFAYNHSGKLSLHDLATRKSEISLPGMYPYGFYWFAPDNALVILYREDKGTYRCDIQEFAKAKPRQSFKLIPTKNPLVPQTFAHLSPDGSKLAVTNGDVISVYDIKTGKAIFQTPVSEAVYTGGVAPARTTSFAFAGSDDDQRLITVEQACGKAKDYGLARVFDLKTKKQSARLTVYEKKADFKGVRQSPWAPWRFECFPYFTPKSEPRVLFNGKIYDVATGKVLHEFDQGAGAGITRDGRYLVRLTPIAGKMLVNNIEIWSLGLEK